MFITYSLTKINRKSKSEVLKYQFWVVTYTVVFFALLGLKRFIASSQSEIHRLLKFVARFNDEQYIYLGMVGILFLSA